MKTEVKNDSQKDAAVTFQPLNVCGMKKRLRVGERRKCLMFKMFGVDGT